MPKLYIPKEEVVDKVAPDVFFESVVISVDSNRDNYATITYLVKDDKNEWHKNEYLNKNLYLYLKVNEEVVLKESLISIAGKINSGMTKHKFVYNIKGPDITLSGYCGNDYITGDITTERVLKNNAVVETTIEDKKYFYISKVKDTRILRSNINFLNARSIENKIVNSSLLVSYNIFKKAQVGFIFDLDRYLTNTSLPYRILSSNANLKRQILNKFIFPRESVTFYKRNISSKNDGYTRIRNTPLILKLSKDTLDTRYLITVTDNNNSLFNFNEYDIRAEISIGNTINETIKNIFINTLQASIKFIKNYTSNINSLKKNQLIKDYRVFFLENEYRKYSKAYISNIVNKLSYLYSMITLTKIDSFYALFTNMFHPLTMEESLFDLLLENLNSLEKKFNELLTSNVSISDTGDADTSKKSNTLIIDFKEKIDYSYDYDHGYDVVIGSNYDRTLKTNINGLLQFTSLQIDERKNREINKFFEMSSIKPEDINHFSISNIFLGENKLFLGALEDNTLTKQNTDILIKLNEYNDHNFKYNTQESSYLQLLSKNIYIKEISNGKNTSSNKFLKDVFFDTNIDSSESSKETIKKTGLSDLYRLFMPNKYIDVRSFIINQFSSKAALTKFKDLNYIDDEKEYYTLNPRMAGDTKTSDAMVLLYNNFFRQKLMYFGDNIEIYKVEKTMVNDIFTKKLKLFNEYYIIQKNDLSEAVKEPEDRPYEFELVNYNVEPIYLNRNVVKHTLKDILKEL